MFGRTAGKQARLTLLEAWFSRLRYSALPALALAAFALALLSPMSLSPASAETRTLKLYNTHTHERVSITFKRNGRYVSEGLRELNRFLRDWRRNESTKMDPKLFDLIWEVYQQAGTNEAIHVVSSYRSPATNNMLRGRSRGVAKNSQHTRGKAMDFFIPGVNISKLRAIGLRKEIGGVGFYPTSRTPFVHMDTGSVRHWPRMTRSQLAKVFPRGDTIHVPTDGKKMPGYAEALARHKRGVSSRPTAVASASSGTLRRSGDIEDGGITRRPAGGASSGGPSLFARIFGGDEDEGEDVATQPTPPAPVTRTQVASAAPAPAAESPAPVPTEAPPGVRSAAAPAPVPAAASESATIVQVMPRLKPQDFPAIVAAAAGAGNGGTLDGQARRLAGGLPAVEATTVAAAEQTPAAQAPITVAAIAPPAKPAELRQGPIEASTGAALAAARPRPAPTDGVSAIAAATGVQPGRKPQVDIAGATLAYAPATASASALGTSTASQTRAPAASAAPAARQASVSGRLPEPVIRDPLARFAALPDRTAIPDIISGLTNTRAQTFAQLQHPNQRRLELLMAPGGRVYANRFGVSARDGEMPRPDRFEGPAVVLLPVVSLH